MTRSTMMYAVSGWAAGVAIALVIVALVPQVGFVGSAALGYGLSMIGLLLGFNAGTRR